MSATLASVMPTFLHLTDAHVSNAGVPYPRDDFKVLVPGLTPQTRESMLADVFGRLAERLQRDKIELDAVLFSGDAQNRGAPGGHELVLKLILDHLRPFGIDESRIVATPGNHDVPQGSAPSSAERYEAFNKVWRANGCVVPWLDGVDAFPLAGVDYDRHRLVAGDCSWAIFPLNSSNWSHVSSVLRPPLSDVWEKIGPTLAPDDALIAQRISGQLADLARYDMARLSDKQLEVLRLLMLATPQAEHRQLRMAMMHHHLRAPSLREELKPFADISNLEQVRETLRAGGVDVVLHGHKHEHAASYDHAYLGDRTTHHRTLVISGATFEVGRENDVMRLLEVSGLPHVPEVVITPLPLTRAGVPWCAGPSVRRRLWLQEFVASESVALVAGLPVVIHGSNIDEVYARACAAAAADAARGLVIVHLDLARDEVLPLPSTYPLPEMEGDARQEWLKDLVGWWQRERSQLEHRIPYVHGVRLRRYGGKINQIDRVIKLLRTKESTRALAILVDPFRDFQADLTQEEFASFCLVEFRRRSVGREIMLDAIAFYRAQEFTKWWPINVAELRALQIEICAELNFVPSRITTIAADARTIARSPTQVAMPIIDRWLDQAPERLHLLADALIYGVVRDDAQQRAVKGWRLTLAELQQACMAFNSDGIPIAIEGLRVLAAYLRVSASEATSLSIAATAEELANHNERYERTKKERADFDLWAPATKAHISQLESATNSRLGG